MYSPIDSDQLTALSVYSACDVSDALLKLQKTVPGKVPYAGYLADIVPFASASSSLSCTQKPPKVIGPALTLKLVAKGSLSSPLPESDPGAIPKGRHWVDLTEEGTVVVIEQPEDHLCAAIGGIMALRMKVRGVKGCVVGGRIRDLEELSSCGLPIWARGTSTVSAAAESEVFARNVEVCIGGVRISPGDVIFCDPSEGVVAIPQNLWEEVIALVPALVAADKKVKEDVRGGESVASAFKRHRG